MADPVEKTVHYLMWPLFQLLAALGLILLGAAAYSLLVQVQTDPSTVGYLTINAIRP